MRSYRHILSITLLLFTLAWSLWYVFAGFGNPQDPLYWLNKYASLQGGWLAIGSILIGGGVVHLFDAELLPLRMANWLCATAAIAVPYLVLLNRDERRDNLHWLALAIGLMNYGAFQELSPGTLTVPLLSSIATMAICYLRKPTAGLQAGLGIITGLAIMVRFPNVLVLLLLLPLFKRNNWLFIIATLLSGGVVCLLGHFIVTPAPMDQAMSSHDLLDIITPLWERGAMLLGFALMWFGVWAIGKISPRYAIAIGIAVGAVLCYYVAYAFPVHRWYNTDLTYMISAGCLTLAVLLNRREVWLAAAILAVAALGTDVGWLKLFPAVLCLLPIVGAWLPQETKRYLFPVLLAFTAAVMVRFAVNSVGNHNLFQARTEAALAPYTHIRITETEDLWLRQLKADYDSLRACTPSETPILSVGREMHRARAVTGCEAARYNEFWSNIFDSVYTARYETVVEQESPVILCFYTPEFKTKPAYKDRHSAFEEMVRTHGYREMNRAKYKYMIYIPQNNE